MDGERDAIVRRVVFAGLRVPLMPREKERDAPDAEDLEPYKPNPLTQLHGFSPIYPCSDRFRKARTLRGWIFAGNRIQGHQPVIRAFLEFLKQ